MNVFDLRSNIHVCQPPNYYIRNSYGDMERATSLGKSTAMITSWLVARRPIKGPVPNSTNLMADPRLWRNGLSMSSAMDARVCSTVPLRM